MKEIWISAAVAALMATSCTNEYLVQQPIITKGQPFTLSAEHGMSSRTALVGVRTVWSQGDQIYVSSADGTVYGVLTLSEGEGTDKAEFFGYISGDPSKLAYTIFPAPKSGNVIDLSNYDAGGGQLDAPMIATFSPDNLNNVSFQNETALISQKLTNLTNQEVTLIGAGIGGRLKPMLVDGNWELVKTGTPSDNITIKGAADGTILIPIATSVNEIEDADLGKEKHSLTLTCTISEPNGGTSYSETYTVTVENGSVTTTNVPEIEYEKSVEVETTDGILKGGNVTLSDNVVLTSPLIITKNTTLDLAGCNISNSGALTAVENATSTDALIVVRPGATLTINDSSNGEGSISTDNLVCAIKLTDKMDESSEKNAVASLIVNGGTIQGKDYGISGNGNKNRDRTSLTINGGLIKSLNYTGIFQPQNGSTVITGGTVEGPWAAMEIRSGKLNITGGTFTATGKFVEPSGSKNGVTIQGAAIGVSQHTTEKAIEMNISGGVFNGAYSLYEAELQNEPTDVTLSINGGIFNGRIYSENCKEFISACTFTENSVFNYIKEEAILQINKGVFKLPTSLNGLTFTLVGTDKENCIVDMSDGSTAQYHAKSVTFKNLTMKRKADSYGGLSHTEEEHYVDCIIEGTLVTYAPVTTVMRTQFVPAATEYYNVHIYEGGSVKFEYCDFETSKGRCVYAHGDEADRKYDIEFIECDFISNAVNEENYRPAIALHTEYGINGTLKISGCSNNGNFNTGINGGLWVEWNNDTKAITNLFTKTIDGKTL